jgi:hypothetical protein
MRGIFQPFHGIGRGDRCVVLLSDIAGKRAASLLVTAYPWGGSTPGVRRAIDWEWSIHAMADEDSTTPTS